ncbi:hypothetical protein ACFQDN_11090 [Pseudomonas asuensis]|jgi:hypothetical protein|uniref:Uncharacterized protein n=1 Tax=Pseudomonas asuensis TaxID=1825787 RepID=A0ABQ2GNA5_9PSED|nr:hypothetical protein [Pseudomonas asuensis]GGM04918.1 hypothetical protein GCM10009425_15300 [Pseudomonas asuensis]
MNLTITRSLLLVGALGVTTMAFSAWHEPGATVVQGHEGIAYCQTPANARMVKAVPADENLMLFLYGMSQSTTGAR